MSWRDSTIIVPVTAYHHVSCDERYSRYSSSHATVHHSPVTPLTSRSLSYFSVSTRMNGSGNGKLAAPLTSVLSSKSIVAVAVAERFLLLEPGPLTVVMIGPVPVQLASTETVCDRNRLSRTSANVPLTRTRLRSGSNCVGAGH